MPGSTAVANRFAPIRWICRLRFESLGVDFVQLAEVGVAGAGDQHLDVAKLFGGLVDEVLHRLRVGDVEGQRDGLATVGADLVGDLLTFLHPACPERHRKAMCGKLDRSGRTDARRRARHDGGPAGGVRIEAGHLGNLHGHG